MSHSTEEDPGEADEYNYFIARDPVPNSTNPIDWWRKKKEVYPQLYQYALNLLAIPATSCACERVFSSAKRLITPQRSRLSDDAIEEIECLRNWMLQGIAKEKR